LSAVRLSIAISRAPAGQRPATSVSGLKRGAFGSTLKPRLGAPPLAIVFPCRSISLVASLSTLPDAASTSSSSFTFPST
jgi:hypothetical protein